jgi:hypothetical protein
MDQRDFSFLNIVSQEVIPHFYVLGFGVKTGLFAALMALVLSH